MKITNYMAKRLALALTILPILGGCAFYGSTPAYYSSDGGVVYTTPGPVYVAPPVYDPWYVGPPVFLNFGYRSWGGGHYYRGHHGWHGGGRRGGHFYRGR